MTTPAADLSLPSLATPSGGFWRRHADLLLPAGDRVPGVDLARGLAILGMFAAHVGVTSDDFSTGEGWLSLVHGRSSILFAVIAGVSLALVSGRRTPLTGVPALQARTRILVRAVLLLALAGLLDVLGTPVALILGFYAAYFVLALPFLRWSPPRLAGLALVVAVLGPPVAYWWPEIMLRAELWLPMDGSGALTDFLLTGTYPALVWMAFVLAGLAVGRLDLASRRLQVSLLGGGLVTSFVAYMASALVTGSWLTAVLAGSGPTALIEQQAADASGVYQPEPLPWSAPLPTPEYLWLAGPHTNTTLEVLGSGGFALAVLGLCLLLGSSRAVLRVLAPLAAVGSMALTVYCLQVLAIWAWEDQLMSATGNGELALLVVASLVFATVWRWALGRGPLERFVGWVAGRAASIPAAPAPDPTSRDDGPTAPPTPRGDVQSGA
ncbi:MULTISPECIES: heparan-alpha-glucosaminide N-acetyltransferase domain-containing protein [unclassified Oerskovia]|uniref:heparan-alpha-glucosaminide N-acetyltransferase domain-containing protein n=1 Tax=unclassified Oerskovia TaxID=2619021 RepID=UPI000AD45693|nr:MULTISPECIES: heparan-alpha-glucosaminide N-acetyltransferase domain-containing protein [unclassified Oerskovia]